MKTFSESEPEDSLTVSSYDSSSSILYESPVTPYEEVKYNKDIAKDKRTRIDREKIELTIRENRSLITDPPAEKTTTTTPITIDHNGFTYIRQHTSYLDNSRKVQVVTAYELSPLVQIFWEIEQVNRQVLYYFSKENLIKDQYLRKLMDQEGFVEVISLANFPRIKKILPKLLLADQRAKVLLLAFKCSEPEVFEVKNRSVRLRQSWMGWIIS